MADPTVTVGTQAPEFSLQATDGRTVTLSTLRGTPVILYFYPKDDTPGCTKEACSFQASLPHLAKTQAVVLGVSGDDRNSHQRFAQKYHLTFPLLSDPDASVAKAYGVYKQKSMYGRTYWGIERTTFIIDARGRIVRVFPKVHVDGHAEAVLEALKDTASGSPSAARRATPTAARGG